jgi:AcrR family transcriptional regulator
VTSTRRERARPKSPDERRDDLVHVTLDLLRQHGRQVTTRQIAEAAGVAEGTIFRVVDSKDELVDAAIRRAFDPRELLTRLEEIDPGLPLREKLLRVTATMQQRFRATFVLMQKIGMVRPPDHVHDSPETEAFRARLTELGVRILGRDAESLRVPATEFLHTLRLLTFAGSHPHIADGRLLTPEQVVDTVLDGLLLPTREREA